MSYNANKSVLLRKVILFPDRYYQGTYDDQQVSMTVEEGEHQSLPLFVAPFLGPLTF